VSTGTRAPRGWCGWRIESNSVPPCPPDPLSPCVLPLRAATSHPSTRGNHQALDLHSVTRRELHQATGLRSGRPRQSECVRSAARADRAVLPQSHAAGGPGTGGLARRSCTLFAANTCIGRLIDARHSRQYRPARSSNFAPHHKHSWYTTAAQLRNFTRHSPCVATLFEFGPFLAATLSHLTNDRRICYTPLVREQRRSRGRGVGSHTATSVAPFRSLGASAATSRCRRHQRRTPDHPSPSRPP
jgi:hypothetical protein